MPDQESATPGTSETAQVQPAPEHVHTEPGPTSATTQSPSKPVPTSASGGSVFVGTAFSTISSKMPDPVPETPAPRPSAPGQPERPAPTVADLERERLGLIATAILAGCGRMTASDVLMSLTAPVTPESAQQKLGAALEAARQRLGPATANPLIEQAGLDVPGGRPTMREPEAQPESGAPAESPSP